MGPPLHMNMIPSKMMPVMPINNINNFNYQSQNKNLQYKNPQKENIYSNQNINQMGNNPKSYFNKKKPFDQVNNYDPALVEETGADIYELVEKLYPK
jgi:hypothetical protein